MVLKDTYQAKNYPKLSLYYGNYLLKGISITKYSDLNRDAEGDIRSFFTLYDCYYKDKNDILF